MANPVPADQLSKEAAVEAFLDRSVVCKSEDKCGG